MRCMDDGIWIRAVSDAAGDEELARAVYIKYRVATLAAEQEVAVRKAEAMKKAHVKQTEYEMERESNRVAVINAVSLRMARKRTNPLFYDPKQRAELIFWVFMSLLGLGFLVALFYG